MVVTSNKIFTRWVRHIAKETTRNKKLRMNRKSTVGVINHMYSCSFLLRVMCVNRGSMCSQSRKVIIATQGIAPKNMEMPREYYFFQLLNYTSNLRSRPVAYQE